MNYYDELGLDRAASADEIRQAYKKVARLLHPDQQSDEQLRKVAERQMTRLNEILQVLTGPERRARYDAGLDNSIDSPALATPAARRRIEIRAGTMIWSAVLLVAAFAFVLLFLNSEHGTRVALPPASTPTIEAPRPARTRSQHSVEPLGVAQREKPPQIFKPPPRHTTSSPATDQLPLARSAPEAALNALPAVLPATPSIPLAPPPAPAAPEATHFPLVGMWLYTKPNSNAEGAGKFSYRPEYIEMSIKPAADGRIAGRYRGQFHVPDQAISSEIAFEFEGATGTNTTVFAWHAENGASGEIRLRMLSEASLEATWYTTTFGTGRKLASGSAVLFRN